jgi:predicted glycosyl hydrolase (DUF1957 family)
MSSSESVESVDKRVEKVVEKARERIRERIERCRRVYEALKGLEGDLNELKEISRRLVSVAAEITRTMSEADDAISDAINLVSSG